MDRLLTHPPRSDLTSGFLYALAAYGLWGLFPLYFSLFDSVSPFEVVAYRIIWSLAFCVLLLAVTRSFGSVRDVVRTPRRLGLLTGAAVAITINWTTYVYSVSTDQVVEAALGYFINPLVTVALGVVVLRERLRAWQWIAIAIATVGVVIIGIGEAAAPWLGLVLAFSFGAYGLLKKVARVDAIPSLTIETAVLVPFAFVVLVVIEAAGSAAIASQGWGMGALLALLGPVTAVPLLAYAAAANRLPLSVLGILQYSTPTVIFILGITVFGDTVNTLEWIGFGFIWFALAVFSTDTVRRSRQANRADALEVAEQA
ncbi:MAG: EamA family transporter RarD [Actinomycetota bacterium]